MNMRIQQPSPEAGNAFSTAQIFVPGLDHGPLRLFSCKETAIQHIQKHMLDEHQSAAWQLASSQFAALIRQWGPGRKAACFRMGRKISSDDQLMHDLYQSYAEVVEQALLDAAWLGWFEEGPNSTVALGLSGCVVVIREFIRTAFFPGARVASKAAEKQRLGFSRLHPGATKTTKRLMKMAASHSSSRRLYAIGFATTIKNIKARSGVQEDLFKPETCDRLALKWVTPRLNDASFSKWCEWVEQSAAPAHLAA